MSVVDRAVRAGLLISGARVVFDFSLESFAFDFLHQRRLLATRGHARLVRQAVDRVIPTALICLRFQSRSSSTPVRGAEPGEPTRRPGTGTRATLNAIDSRCGCEKKLFGGMPSESGISETWISLLFFAPMLGMVALLCR